MSDSGSIPDFQYNHADGTKRTRFEMDQWLRAEVPKVHWLRLHASKTFKLPKNISWDMREIVLRHWLLDEMIRQNLISGDQLGVNTTASNDETELRQFIQRLASFIQSGYAVQPQHAEGIDMTSFTPPPPPVGGISTQTYSAGPPAPPPPPGPPGVPMGPPGYQPPMAPPNYSPPGYAPPMGPPGVPSSPPPTMTPAPVGPPAPGPGRRKRAEAAPSASPPAAPVPPMGPPPGFPQPTNFAPVGGFVPVGPHPLGGITGTPAATAAMMGAQTVTLHAPAVLQPTTPVADLTGVLTKLDQVLNNLHSAFARISVLDKKIELLSLMNTVLCRAVYGKIGTPDVEGFLKELGVPLPQ